MIRSIVVFRKLHKWPGIVIALAAILFAASGVILNHRQVFSGIDIPRNLLPPNFRYANWNLFAIRGALPPGDGSLLIYGNVGIWKTSVMNPEIFADFNEGFPRGVDNRNIYALARLGNTLYAGAKFGLYRRGLTEDRWRKLALPVGEERISDVSVQDDTLLVLTRNLLLKTDDGVAFQTIQLPPPPDYEKKVGLFKTIWELHSGELLGLPGMLAVDFLGVIVILLSITGLLHFLFPKIIRRVRNARGAAGRWTGYFQTNLRWHNVAGYAFAAFLVVNTLTGTFLRPPFLLAIIDKNVGVIPGTHLDQPNPWHDKLRRVRWDGNSRRYLFSTSDGFYFAEETLTKNLQPTTPQPPASVMGVNVFEPVGNKTYLLGSFSGMFLWNSETGAVSDFLSGKPYGEPKAKRAHLGKSMATGWVEADNNVWWFDFNRGAVPVSGKRFPAMPEDIRRQSPMSLWNVALDIHTGRIFKHFIGTLSIFYVPVAGICLAMVLVSGFFIWWKAYRRRSSR